MRRVFAICMGLLCLAAVAACSRSATPPVGRWEGTYDSNDVIVAARLEITPKGAIFISAPDALDIGNVSNEDRAAIRQRLADGLAEGWGDVQPRALDFDGKVFRKPGGIAPQIEWDPAARRMVLVVYLGTRPGIRIALRSVNDFSPDPWAGA